MSNAHGAKSHYGGAALTADPNKAFDGGLITGRGANAWSGNTCILQNTRLTGGQLHQIYLSMGRTVDGRRGLDIGGTVDFTWGSDAYHVQSRGLEYETGHGVHRTEGGDSGRWGTGDYYAAFAQAYAEIAYYQWNVKVGKFYKPFGAGSYKSTDNFFYTWSPNEFITPTTGGGVLTTYAVNNRLSVLGGWTMGFEKGYESIGETGKDNFFLGGIDFSPTKRFNVRYVFGIGENTYRPHLDFDAAGVEADKVNYFINSLVTTTKLTDRLTYVFDWTYTQSRAKKDGEYLPRVDTIRTLGGGARYCYGINNEIIFQANKRWAFGTRFGMLNAYDITNYNWDLPEGTKFYNVSLGANWTPNKWLTVKPELRYDWLNKGTLFNSRDNTLTNDMNSSYQFTGGLSAVVKF